jgi:hypothetical protein
MPVYELCMLYLGFSIRVMAQHNVNGSKKSDSYKIITPVMMLANWNHKTFAFTS